MMFRERLHGRSTQLEQCSSYHQSGGRVAAHGGHEVNRTAADRTWRKATKTG